MTVTATINTPPPDPQPDRRVVTLTMPYDVAVTLLNMTRVVCGSPEFSYRKHSDLLQGALLDAQVPYTYNRFVGITVAQSLSTK